MTHRAPPSFSTDRELKVHEVMVTLEFELDRPPDVYTESPPITDVFSITRSESMSDKNLASNTSKIEFWMVTYDWS